MFLFISFVMLRKVAQCKSQFKLKLALGADKATNKYTLWMKPNSHESL